MLFQDFLTTVNNLINVRFHDLWNYDSQVLLKLLFFFSYGTPYSQKMNLYWRSGTVDIKLGLSTDNYISGLRTSKYS